VLVEVKSEVTAESEVPQAHVLARRIKNQNQRRHWRNEVIRGITC